VLEGGKFPPVNQSKNRGKELTADGNKRINHGFHRFHGWGTRTIAAKRRKRRKREFSSPKTKNLKLKT
jgi:hypothetical protein